MKKVLISLLAAGFVAVGGTAWAVDAGSGAAAIDSAAAHNATEAKGTCAKCHIPHGGKGAKIWAQDLTGVASFSGVHQLCNSCHYGLGGTYGATSGLATVFTLNAKQNHSMLNWANTTATVPPATFPLNTGDTDTLWGNPDPDGDGTNRGFYCGSCHNPHKQPVLDAAAVYSGHGDYLRVEGTQTLAEFGASGARLGACTQCHTTTFTGSLATGHTGNCMVCHDPHKGATVASAVPLNNRLAEKILIVPLTGNAFVAAPNVDGFAAGYADSIAAVCFGCHRTADSTVGHLPTGSTKLITNTNEHHPMGTDADIAATGHAPGFAGTGIATLAGEFTCTTCHDMHNATQDFYLRPAAGTYAGTDTDDGTYCVTCHNNKAVASLGASGSAHNQTTANTKGLITGRATCFVCHAIHDAPVGGVAAVAYINAIMRVPPVNFAAAVANADADVNDYEDMCYGCHSASTITSGNGTAGATLQSMGAYFTHKYTGTPSAAVATRMGTFGLPVAAATTTGGVEYGAVADDLYCGSCHNVHVQQGGDNQGQMFRTPNTTATDQSILCVDCHTSSGMPGATAHPTYLDAGYDTDLPSPRTVAAVPNMFGSGGDGVPGGRTAGLVPGGAGAATGNMACETCHSFHTASTDIFGDLLDDGTAGDHGKILVQDNKSTVTGSDMCSACHGTTNY